MIPKNIFFLYSRAGSVKVSKGIHSITCNYSHCNNKLLRPNRSTNWKKMKISYCLPTLYYQRRNIETQDINIIKSPYKDVDVPNTTLLEFLMDSVDKHSKHIAVECGITGRKYTFSQLKKLSKKFAVSLLKAGLKPGQVVAFITSNCPEYPIIFLGCLGAGLVLSPINHVFTPDEICYQLKDSGATCVVSAFEKLEDVNVAVSKINSQSKPENHVKIIALDTHPDSNNLASGIGRFSQLTADYVDESCLTSLLKVHACPTDTAVLLYSSGTTGLPKGVQLSHNNIAVNFLQLTEATVHIETTDSFQDTVPVILPFYHVYGLGQLLVNGLRYGCKLVTLPKFEPNTFYNLLKNHKCSILYLVPPLVLFMGSSDKITKEHCSHIRWIICGAAPLGSSDLERCLNKMPSENKTRYCQGYGMTEAGVIAFPPHNVSNLSTVGAPVASTLMKIIDVESGKTLRPNKEGEVCIKGPQVMVSYLNQKTKDASIDAEGWLHTGDLGYYDEDQLFYIKDRIKELIKVKGYQVAPAELEEVLRALPGIEDVCVIGVPNEKTGEAPVAFIVPSPTEPVTISDVKSYMSKRVAPFKQLAEIFCVNTLPKAGSGKLLRRNVRQNYLELKKG